MELECIENAKIIDSKKSMHYWGASNDRLPMLPVPNNMLDSQVGDSETEDECEVQDVAPQQNDDMVFCEQVGSYRIYCRKQDFPLNRASDDLETPTTNYVSNFSGKSTEMNDDFVFHESFKANGTIRILKKVQTNKKDIKKSSKVKPSPSSARKRKCGQCDKTYLHQSSLYHHRITNHSGIECISCGKTFISNLALKCHMDRCTPTEKNWKCNQCGIECGNQCSVALHKKSHIEAGKNESAPKIKYSDVFRSFAGLNDD